MNQQSEGRTERKPLDAQVVGKTNAAALKALSDTGARRKWADSTHGSPLTTNMLCAEIARLNIELEEKTTALQMTIPALEWCEKQWANSPQKGDGLNVLALVRAALSNTGETA